MNRILFISLFWISLFDSSCGQKPAKQSSKPVEITRVLDSKNPKDSALVDSIRKSHGDSLPKEGEFVSTAYTIQFSIEPLGWTSDFEHVFSKEQIMELDSLIGRFEQATTNEIAIVTIDSLWTTGDKFDSLILKIGINWGVGKKDKNNGVVIGVSKGLRKIRINTGNGVEGKITDMEAKKIIETIIIPEYKQGNYFEGTKKGLLAIIEELR
jgi:uncharacterized protein